MKPLIRIDLCDMGAGFGKADHFLYRTLSERFHLYLCDQPDFLIYDVAGYSHKLHSCVRIRYTCESSPPDFAECDYSIGPIMLDDPRHLYVPGYLPYGTADEIIKRPGEAEQVLATKNKFCSFVVSGHHARRNRNRLEIFNALSQYKRVDSGGRFMNNIGGPIPGGPPGKVEFLRAYKFNLCYENAAKPGYVTEKIYQAMAARCVPIFWGDPLVDRHFNRKSFISRSDFRTDEDMVERVKELDQDDGKFMEVMREPYLPNNQPNVFYDTNRILDFFERVFTTRIEPAARRRKWFAIGRWTLVKRHSRHALPNGWQ